MGIENLCALRIDDNSCDSSCVTLSNFRSAIDMHLSVIFFGPNYRKEVIFMNVNELAEKILIICIENKITASKLLKAVSKVIVEFHSKGTIEK